MIYRRILTLALALPACFLGPASARAEGAAGGVDPAAQPAVHPAVHPAGNPAGHPAGTGPRDDVTVTIVAERQTLVLGADRGTTLLVTVAGPAAATALPGRTRATVGFMGPLVPLGTPGSFIAEYRVPIDRRPQSGIIAVEILFPGGRRVYATTHLMLPAAAHFPLRTSPDAMVSLEIAGRSFGPRRADATGHVHIPIVVPPGVAIGRARAVNRFAAVSETDVDLQPRDYPRVLLLAAPDAEAGTTVPVSAWAVEPSGDPSLPEDIDLRASAGSIRRVGGGPGVAAFTFALPQKVGAANVTLVASMDDGTSVTSDSMAVHAGPAAEIRIDSDIPQLVVASLAVAHLSFVAVDRFGNVVSIAGLVVTVDGKPLPTSVLSGGAGAEVGAPETWPGRDHILIAASLGGVQAQRPLPLTGSEPTRVVLTTSASKVDANGRNAVDLLLEVFDDRGTPTSAHRVAWQTDDDSSMESLPSPRFGTYAVRFVPRRALRDRSAVIAAAIDAGLAASARVMVEAGATRTAAARVGVASNLGSSFGQTAFVEATVPLARLGRYGRLLSAGMLVGYLHSEVTTAKAAVFPSVHVDINQAPIMALARMRIPGEWPVEISVSGVAGLTFAVTQVTPGADFAFGATRGTAHALMLGAGVDASVLLQPGELVMGARYLYADLGRNSNGDTIGGNSAGVICDLGFRMGF